MATAKIQVLSDGSMRGTSFPLTKESYTLGRSESCDICIPDGTISGHHCSLIQIEGGGFILRDEGSTNGTRVNGEKVEPGVEIALGNGDIFQVGGIEMLYDSGENARMETTHTATVINLEDTGNVEHQTVGMTNMGMKTGVTKKGTLRDNHGQKVIFQILIGLLVLGVLVALGYCAMGIMGAG